MNGDPSPFLKKTGQRATAARIPLRLADQRATNRRSGVTESEYSPRSDATTSQ
jgi:hypothetical protein